MLNISLSILVNLNYLKKETLTQYRIVNYLS